MVAIGVSGYSNIVFSYLNNIQFFELFKAQYFKGITLPKQTNDSALGG